MKIIILLVVLFCATACDSQSTKTEVDEKSDEKTSDTKTEKKKKRTSETKPLRSKKPKWKIEYKGDLSGEVSGTVLSVVKVTSIVAIAGGAIQEDARKGSATQELSVKVTNEKGGEANVRLVLPDGTECLDVRRSKGLFSKIDVKDDDKKTYRATLSGDLSCGENGEKKITYTGMLNRRP